MKKWCDNCKTWKESWVDKGYSSDERNYGLRCWTCDNYSLDIFFISRNIPISDSSCLNRDEVFRCVREIRLGQRNDFRCEGRSYNYSNGETIHEILEYNGSERYTHTTIIRKSNNEVRELVMKSKDLEARVEFPCSVM